jgi:hypothetical protein
MKKLQIIAILCIMTISAAGQMYEGSSFRTQSYYGFSGLTFIPNSQVMSPGRIGVSYASKPGTGSEINLVPYSVRLGYGLPVGNLEVSTTNTPFYSSERIYDGVSISHGVGDLQLVLPVFPSVKYRLMPMDQENYHVGMAIGFALPYGGYYVVDKFFPVNFFDITVHTGVGTKLTTYHVFGGITVTFGNRTGMMNRDFNLEMMIEGAWGGSLKQIDKKEESFISLSFRHAWTATLYMTAFVRYDNQPLTEDGSVVSEGPISRMGVGLDYSWK